MFEKPALIIDSMNMFTRAYAAYPSMNSNGESAGGTVGSMKMMQRLVNEMSPSSVYLVWESGGSARRRTLYKDYKKNRRPAKLNRFYEDDIPDSDENRMHQIVVLLSLLKHVPIRQVYVADCEADDVIAYLCKGPLLRVEKVIASSDRDFYQLLDDKTIIYSFHTKDYVTPESVLEAHSIAAHNFAIAKTLCGDASDNVPGIGGVGFKTLVKKFPIVGTSADVLLEDIINYSAAHVDESPIYRRVVESKDEIVRNWRLVKLDVSSLSPNQVMKVDTTLQTSQLSCDKIAFMRVLAKEGIQNFDVDSFFRTMRRLNEESIASKDVDQK